MCYDYSNFEPKGKDEGTDMETTRRRRQQEEENTDVQEMISDVMDITMKLRQHFSAVVFNALGRDDNALVGAMAKSAQSHIATLMAAKKITDKLDEIKDAIINTEFRGI